MLKASVFELGSELMRCDERFPGSAIFPIPWCEFLRSGTLGDELLEQAPEELERP